MQTRESTARSELLGETKGAMATVGWNIRAIDVQFVDLAYEIREGYRGARKPILRGISGRFKSGELTAIIGPSGAGKSTLLNLLTGYQEERIGGRIEYIGENASTQVKGYRKDVCYIQQVDCLYGLFSVNETMRIAAYLKIGECMDKKPRQLLIDGILETLKLLTVKDTRVERLSGGQKKRLSIALELIHNPSIMFLDEPTTGLDSLSSLQCIVTLRTLAKTGRTVICTIHQPSATIYQMFDYVYLVVNGQCMYAGPPDRTVAYLARQGLQCPKYHNPADYVMEVVSREYGDYDDRLIAAAKAECWRHEPRSMARKRDAAVPHGEPHRLLQPTEMTRFWILLHRYVLLLYRDRYVTRLKVVLHFLVAVLLGLTYEHAGEDGSKTISNISFLLVTVVYIVYTSLMPAVLRFPFELAIIKKERFNNWYQLRTYYIATLVTSVPLQMFLCLIYTTVSYLLSSQPLEWCRFLMYLLIAVLTSFTAEAMGLGLGTYFSPVNGTFFGAITACVMICLAGFLILFNHMPAFLYYMSYLSYIRYAFEGLVQAVYGNNREKLYCPTEMIYCHYREPSIILEELYMSRPMFWIDVAVLFAYFVVLRIAVYVALKKKLSKMC